MHSKKLLQESLKTHFLGVVGDFNCLGMTGIFIANLLIARVFGLAANVPRFGFDNAGDLVEVVLHAPETPRRKNSNITSRLTLPTSGAGGTGRLLAHCGVISSGAPSKYQSVHVSLLLGASLHCIQARVLLNFAIYS